jgi:hypothetical protein
VDNSRLNPDPLWITSAISAGQPADHSCGQLQLPVDRLEKTIVVGGRNTSGMTPGEIDRYVRAQLAAGADLYSILQPEAVPAPPAHVVRRVAPAI